METLQPSRAVAEPGNHTCLACVSDDDRLASVVRFVTDGLAAGDMCIYAADADELAAVAHRLVAKGQDVDALAARQQLVLMNHELAYGPAGTLDAAHTLGQIRHALSQRAALGFRGLRAAGGGLARRGSVDGERLARYEAAVETLLADEPAAALCIYDRRHASPEVMRVGLRTHRQALLGGRLCANPFFEPEGIPPARAVDWMIHQILRGDDARAALGEIRHDLDTAARACKARDQLMSMLARQMSEPVRDLGRLLDAFGGATAAGEASAFVEAVRDRADGLQALVDRLNQIAEVVNLEEPLRPERVDLRTVVDLALDAIRARTSYALIPDLRIRCDEPLTGSWDRARLCHVMQGLIEIGCEHSWGTAMTLTLERVGPLARISLRYQGPGVESPHTDHDRLGISLFVTRERLRQMGGTLGIATWPAGAVVFTAELPTGG